MSLLAFPLPVRLGAVVAVAVAVSLALVPSSAHAGTYVHAPCRGFTASAIGDDAGGWRSSTDWHYGSNENACAAGGGYLRTQMVNNSLPVPAWNTVGFAYQAPSDTKIARFSGAWAGWARPLSEWGGGIIHILGDGFDLGEVRDYADGRPKPFDQAGLDGSMIHMTLGCWAVTACAVDPNGFGWLALWDPTVVLRDSLAPTAGGTFGAAVTSTRWRGTHRFSYSAADRGGGIHHLRLYVDGALKEQSVPDDRGGRCEQRAAGGDGRVFGSPVPCPLGVNAVRDVDTASIPDGQHTVRFAVEDVAGNETPLYEATKVVSNHPPVNSVAPAWRDPVQAAAPHVGQLLTADRGVWTGPSLTYATVWQRCSAIGTECVAIPGATTLDYIPMPPDAGQRLRVVVTVANAGDTVTLATPMSGVVAAEQSGLGAPVAQPPGLPGAPVAAAAAHLFQGEVVGEAPNATCPGDEASLRVLAAPRGRLTLSYGRRRTVTVALTCRQSGRAIARAGLQIATRLGSGTPVAGELTTDAAGRARLVLGAGPSRGVTVGYRMYADEAIARATTTLRVAVRGRVGLRASRHRLRNGQAVTLSGRLAGGYVPRRGVTLAVQWRDGRRWRPFAQIRTDRHGNFRYAYRFTRTNRLVAYQLRVEVTRGQLDYPFLPAASAAVRLLVGP